MEQVAYIIGLGKNRRMLELILRSAISATFLGHGVYALGAKPEWVRLITAFGISEETAVLLLPVIGMMDITIAFFSLFRPVKGILIWAAAWAFLAALSRPIAGDPVWDFLERATNWIVPLSLLFIQGFPKKFKEWVLVR